MKAAAHLVVGHDAAGCRARDVRCEPPLTVRRAGGRFLLVGSAAGPVGGDELSLGVEVEAGATAKVGTAAATIVWPGPTGAPSSMVSDLVVGAGAMLDFRSEPVVSVMRSRHRIDTTVRLGQGARCRVVEEVVLGRHGEPSGELETRIRVVRDGVPIVHHAEHFGPDVAGAGSLARVAGARHVVTAVVVGGGGGVDGGGPRVTFDGSVAAGWLPVAPDAAVVLGVGPDRPTVLATLDRIAPGRIVPGTIRPVRSEVIRPSAL